MQNPKNVPTSSHKSNVNGFDSYARISGNFSEPSSKEIHVHQKEAIKHSSSHLREEKPSSSLKPQIPESQKSTYSEIDKRRSQSKQHMQENASQNQRHLQNNFVEQPSSISKNPASSFIEAPSTFSGNHKMYNEEEFVQTYEEPSAFNEDDSAISMDKSQSRVRDGFKKVQN